MPREAMGLGDVKFMAANDAFTGRPGVLFSLVASMLRAMISFAWAVPLVPQMGQTTTQPIWPFTGLTSNA
jgi:hypothetical protein